MRRIFSLFTMLMLCGVLAFAQSRVVSGKVTDVDGNAVPFATIKIKGSRNGVSADANGNYTINVKSDAVLEISGASFKTVDVPVGNLSVINTVMERAATSELKEVVVTGAYGVKRSLKTSTSNTQVVSGEQLNTIRNTNINDAIAGKVSGIQVRSQAGGKLTSNGNVRLRGEGKLFGGSNVLYVLDGTKVAADDINVDDVEDVTVLQGPAAAALFGPDGATGAIIITTKRGKRSTKGVGIELNLGVRYDNVYILPNYQNSYAGGDFGDLKLYTWKAGQPVAWKVLSGKYYPDYSEDVSWGPRMIGQEYIPWYSWYSGHERSFTTAKLTPQPSNARDFYNTQFKKQNSVTFTKATDALNTRITYTNIDVQGLIPTTWLKKNSLSTGTTIDLSNRVSLGLNLNYYSQQSNGDFNDAYANQSSGSFNQWFHRDLDMAIVKELKDLRTPTGIQSSWNHNGPDNYNPNNEKDFYGVYYWANFYTSYDQIQSLTNYSKLFGDVSLTYKVNNDFKIKGTYRDVRYSGFNEQKISSDLADMKFASQATAFTKGGYSSTTATINDQHVELLGSYVKTIRNFSVTANAGLDMHSYTSHTNNGQTFDGLNVPNIFSLSNSKGAVRTSDSRLNQKDRAVFLTTQIGWRKIINVDVTLRNDWLSQLPTNGNQNSIFSKSVGGSFVFGDLIKNMAPFITTGKLRASYGQIPGTLGIYQFPGSQYTSQSQQWNGNFFMFTNPAVTDPLLHGYTTSQTEFGIDMAFLKNRVGFSVTYWKAKDKDYANSVPITGTSGQTSFLTNSGEIRRKGIDVQFNLTPVKMKNLTWDINANWGTILDNKIVSIDKDPTNAASIVLENTYSATYGLRLRATEGEQWGILFGNGIKRDASGAAFINPDGTYVYDQNVNFGSVIPKYTGGVQNSLTVFKNFTLNFNIDYQVGGKFFSVSDMFGTSTGVLAKTAVLNDKGIPERDPIADGGGHHIFGVDPTTLKPVDYYVNVRDYYDYSRKTNDLWVYDLTFVKLREVGIGYNIPVNRLGIGKYITKANFSVIASQPWLIYAKTKDFDPSEISNQSGEGAQFPGLRGVGVNLKVGF